MAEMKFEEALKRLEKIVDDLESGDLPLDEALSRYEEGIRLSNVCSKKLENARNKVEMLLKNPDGSVSLKEFDESGESQEARAPLKKRKPKSGSTEALL